MTGLTFFQEVAKNWMNEVIKAYANVLMLRFDCSQGQLYLWI